MILSLFEINPAAAVAVLLGFVVGITVHEAAHAYSALQLGDDTAYRQGRVTLNPAMHLDLLGSLMLLFAGFGWGRPTPVNLAALRGGLWGPVAVAFAGPLSNILLVAVCAVVYQLPGVQGAYFESVVVGVAFVNALLFVFNLLPIPPLDGSKIIFPFLPRSLDGFVSFMNQYGPLILLGIILVSFFVPGINLIALIFAPIQPIMLFFGLPPSPFAV
jgi:Zn-dependent protease